MLHHALKAAAIALAFAAGSAHAQNFPSRSITIVSGTAGSGQDLTARLMSPGMSEKLGQSVVVDNRGITGIRAVAVAPRDGYTLLLYGPTLWMQPLMQADAGYDAIRDFAAVTLAAVSPNILAVPASLPVKSVKELIAYLKERPGQLNYGSGTAGSNGHLAGELFKSMTGVDFVAVMFKAASPMMIDMIAGRVHFAIVSAGTSAPHIKSGKVRGLGVASARPTAIFPGMPTMAATLPGFESSAMTAVVVPAGTPGPVISRLNQEAVRALSAAEVKEKLLAAGIEVVGSSPGELDAAIKNEMTLMGKLIKDLGIHE